MRYYRLEGKTPVPTEKLEEMQIGARVALDDLNDYGGHQLARVSTVFLGIDHSHRPDGEPVLFETMIFGGPLDQEMRRYHTWEEAEKGHAEMVRLAKGVEHEGQD